jgi:hypothetical protein
MQVLVAPWNMYYKKFIVQAPGSTVVDLWTRNLKIVSLKPATGAVSEEMKQSAIAQI